MVDIKSENYSVAFATGSRADYGIVRKYLSFMNEDENIQLSILATGALLSDEYAHQVDLIYRDGFEIGAEFDISLDSVNNAGILHSMSIAVDKFGSFFETHKYDLLIILGDRYEMLSVAIAAAIQRIPILHIHGGEATYGNYDEFIRHAITKMSWFHFTATEEYRKRVIQLGERPENVYYLGALGAENCLNIDEAEVSEEVKQFEGDRYFVVLFHPETLTNASVAEQTVELLAALAADEESQYVFLGSNADTYSNEIRALVQRFVEAHKNCFYFENLPTCGYHYLLKNSLGLIGNSSSGIIEAPSLGVYTVNIGDRQAGRVRGNSIIDVQCERRAIQTAIEKVKQGNHCDKIRNPYYRANAATVYYSTTKDILDKLKETVRFPKKFYDLSKSDIEDRAEIARLLHTSIQ